MLKKIFLLYHNYTSVFMSMMIILGVPALLLDLATEYGCFLIWFWLLVNTGYSNNWHK